MIFLMQFGINKHLLIFSKTTNCTHPTGSYNFVSLKKNLLVLIYRNHVTIPIQIAPCFALNCIFFQINVKAVLKHNNQSDKQ